MKILNSNPWVLTGAAVLCLAFAGCGESERISGIEKALQEQKKKSEKSREEHSELKESIDTVTKKLETLNEQLAALKKEQAEIRTRIAELWTDDVDKSVFEKWKSGLDVPAVRVHRVAEPPVIDGKLDELYTKHAAPMKFFRIEQTKPDRSSDSFVKSYVVMGTEALYIAVRIEASVPATLHSTMHKRDSSLWDEESIDIFISPGREGGYYQIITNVIGTLYDAKSGDTSWNPDITVTCDTEKQEAWVMEMKIPLKEIGVKRAEIRKVWSFNITYFCPSRDPLQRDTDMAWSPTGTGSSHVPERFGWLWMAFTGRPDPKELKREGY